MYVSRGSYVAAGKHLISRPTRSVYGKVSLASSSSLSLNRKCRIVEGLETDENTGVLNGFVGRRLKWFFGIITIQTIYLNTAVRAQLIFKKKVVRTEFTAKLIKIQLNGGCFRYTVNSSRNPLIEYLSKRVTPSYDTPRIGQKYNIIK